MTECLTLPSRLDSSAAPALMRGLLEKRGRPLAIDASRVEMAGALACEVIIAAKRQWAEDGLELTFTVVSDRFHAIWRVLGLSATSPLGTAGLDGKVGDA